MLDMQAGLPIDSDAPSRRGAHDRGAVAQANDDMPRCAALDTAEVMAACDGIIDLLSVFFNVSGRQLRSPRRTSKPVSRVRQIGMYVAHVTLGMKMTAVGAGFGRDKSTVVHSCHTIEDMRDDEDFDLIVSRVERLIVVAFSLERNGVRRDG